MIEKQFCLARFYESHYEANLRAFGWMRDDQIAEWVRGKKAGVQLEDHSVERSHLNLKVKVLPCTDIILLDTFGAFQAFGLRAFEVASQRYIDLLTLPDDSLIWGIRVIQDETLTPHTDNG